MRPVELLGQHDPHERMGESQSGQRPLEIAAGDHLGHETVGSADEKGEITAVALADARGVAVQLSVSTVRFRDLSSQECAEYWETGEPRDKAGGYAVQGAAAVFIESLSGSYSGVMGLPLFETAGLLRAAGVPYWEKR